MVSIREILNLEALVAAKARPQAARRKVRLIADTALGETAEGVVAAWQAANASADVDFIVREIVDPQPARH